MNLNQEQLSQLFSLLDELVVLFSEGGEYLEILSSGSGFRENDLKSFVGKNIKEVLSTGAAGLFISKITECINENRTIEYEYQISGLADSTSGELHENSNITFYKAKLIPTVYSGEKAVIWIAYDISDVKRLEAFSKEKTVEDPTTGLYNRKYFFRELNNFYRRFKRTGNNYTVIMINLDNGEKLKDTYGLAVTDGILEAFLEVIKNALRVSDLFAAIGDEDFIILLPDTVSDGACNTAERVRGAIENNIYELDGEQLNITASFGCSEVSEEDSSYDNVLNRAEIALYQAKHSGGNCVRKLDYANWSS